MRISSELFDLLESYASEVIDSFYYYLHFSDTFKTSCVMKSNSEFTLHCPWFGHWNVTFLGLALVPHSGEASMGTKGIIRDIVPNSRPGRGSVLGAGTRA